MKKLFYYLSVVALFVLTACNGATFITPDKDAVSFAIDGGEESVNISADGSWSVADCPDWAKTNVQGNVLVIRTERNETGSVREGDIVLSGKGDVKATIKVTQASKCTHITPASDKVEFEKEGGTQTVNIDTDGLPHVEASDGFSATYAGGVLSITASANEAGAKRGEIKLTCEDKSVTIYASQKGNICPTCGGSGKIKCSKCGGHGFTSDWHDDGLVEWGGQYGCKKCGGGGAMTSDGDDGSFRKGSGSVTCPTCGGSGH